MAVDRSLLSPDLNERLDRLAEQLAAEGISVRLVSGRRSCAEQAALYALGRTAPGQIVTHARGCLSWHVVGRAVDFDFGSPPSTGHRPTEADYAHVGALWEQLGGVWGGHFPGFVDLPHLEYHPGLRITDVCPNPDACQDGAIVGPASPPLGPLPLPLSPAAISPIGVVFALASVGALALLLHRARS